MDLLLESTDTERYIPGGASVRGNPTDRELAAIDALAHLLDTRWQFPVFGFKFGLDALVGLVPVVGDIATGLVSAHIVYRATQLGASRWLLARMITNVAIDTIFGSVPVVGSVFDVFFKSNIRNVRLLRRHVERRARQPGQILRKEPPR
jgi:hypothetical protein